MSVRTTLLTAATVLATLAGAAQAEPIKARAGGSVSLGDVAGVAYYTPESTGYRVVVTLAGTESAGPVRFETVLANGQSVTLSTPRDLGGETQAIEILRTGDSVSVSRAKPAVTREAAALN